MQQLQGGGIPSGHREHAIASCCLNILKGLSEVAAEMCRWGQHARRWAHTRGMQLDQHAVQHQQLATLGH